MILYVLFLGLSLFSSQLAADRHMPDAVQNKRLMIDTTVQNVNELFDAMLEELNEAHTMYHTSCKKAQVLEQENERIHAIEAELIMAQKDLQKAMENEAAMKNKLTQLQQQAGKEITNMRDEFESFKARLETKTNNFDKIFW